MIPPFVPVPPSAESFLEMTAYHKFWNTFRIDDGETDPSPEKKKNWLESTLAQWGSLTREILSTPPARRDNGEILALLLQSLSHAAETLLVYKKKDQAVHLPDVFLNQANALLVACERGEIETPGRSLYQLAHMLSAAARNKESQSQEINVQEKGQVFSLDGERVMAFDPQRILKGREEIKAGRTRSLKAIRGGEPDAD